MQRNIEFHSPAMMREIAALTEHCLMCTKYNVAVERCDACASFLCDFCANVHNSMPFFKSHTSVPLERYIAHKRQQLNRVSVVAWLLSRCERRLLYSSEKTDVSAEIAAPLIAKQTLGGFDAPFGLCVDTQGRIVVSDTRSHCVQVFSKTGGELLLQFGGTCGRGDDDRRYYSGSRPLNKAIFVTSTDLYALCDKNVFPRVQFFDQRGRLVRRLSLKHEHNFDSMAMDQHSHIVVLSSLECRLYFYNSTSGELVRWFSLEDFVLYPCALVVRQQEYFVCDSRRRFVVVFDELGRYLRTIGTASQLPVRPTAMDVSERGNVVVAGVDATDRRLRVTMYAAPSDGGLLWPSSHFVGPVLASCTAIRFESHDGGLLALDKANNQVLSLNTYSYGYVKRIILGEREMSGGPVKGRFSEE